MSLAAITRLQSGSASNVAAAGVAAGIVAVVAQTAGKRLVTAANAGKAAAIGSS